MNTEELMNLVCELVAGSGYSVFTKSDGGRTVVCVTRTGYGCGFLTMSVEKGRNIKILTRGQVHLYNLEPAMLESAKWSLRKLIVLEILRDDETVTYLHRDMLHD